MTKLMTVLCLVGSSLIGATRYISPSGNDANSCTAAARCKSINAAFQLSTNGDIILAQAGTYSDVQEIRKNKMGGTFDQTPVSSNVVTLMPESGSVTFGDEVHFSDSFTGTPVQHLAFQNVTFGGFVAIKSAQDIHFTNTHFADMSQWTCATEVSIQNSEIGPFTTDFGDGIDLYGKAYNSCNLTPGNWLIETSTIHGVSTNVSIAHPDAIALDDGANVTIRRNRFWNNCGDDLRMATAGPPTNVVIQNNFFGAPVSCAAGAATTAQIVGVGTVVSYNTFDGWVQTVTSEYASFAANQLWEGNIITQTVQGLSGNCPPGAGTIARYNVWNTDNSSSCGSNNIRLANFAGWFVNPSISAGDYHLTSAATAALGAGNPSSYPAVDIDGKSRSGKPDAGASQFSAGSAPLSAPNPPTNLTSLVK